MSTAPAQRRGHGGYILLPVVLAITLVAAVAYLVNREAGMAVRLAAGESQAEQARYAAEAGLRHALWQLEQKGCGPFTDLAAAPLGAGSYDLAFTTDATGPTTVHSAPVDQDAFVKEDTPSQNYGNVSDLYVENTAPRSRLALVRFDLSGVPAGETIVSAVAKIFVLVEDPGTPLGVHQVTADWAEDTVNWITFGSSYASAAAASIPDPGASWTWIDVNLTDLARAWHEGTAPNHGIVLVATSTASPSSYASKEYGDTSKHPWLEVVTSSGIVPSRALVKATGRAGGAVRGVTRQNLTLYQKPNQQLVLQPDAASGKDTYVYEWKPGWNYGVDNTVFVSNRYAYSLAHGLLQFDLGAVPGTVRVARATIALYQDSTAATGGTVNVHALSSAWAEGAASGGNGAANWSERDTATGWSTTGGDLGARVYASTQLSAGTLGWYQWDVTDLVAGWVDGTAVNHGLALVPAAPNTEVHFSSSDATDPTLHPKLTVEYTCACGSTPGGSLTLQPDAAAGKDAWLTEVKPDWHYGALGVIKVRGTVGGAYHGALEFDLTGVPAGALVWRARLGLNAAVVNTAGPVGVHRLTADWVEGPDSVNPAEPGVTWNQRDTGQPWASPGGDFDPAPADSLQVDTTGAWYEWDVTALAAGWVNGSLANNGLVLVPGDIAGSFEFRSSDATDETLRPTLTVDYYCPCGVDCTGTGASDVGHWMLDDASGTVATDSSGGGRHGTLSAAGPTWTTGTIGGALAFDGVDDRVLVPDSPALDITDAITLSAWVRPNTTGTQYVIRKAQFDATDGYELSLSSTGAVFFRLNQATHANTYRIDSVTHYPTDGLTWMHIAATYDGAVQRLYIDGVEEANLGAAITIAANATDLSLGGQADGTQVINGALDDVRLYGRALDAAEIVTLAKAPTTPPTFTTTVTLNPTQDTFLGADDTTVWGGDGSIYAGFGSREWRPLVQFDLSGITPGTVVQSATLRLFNWEAGPTAGPVTARAYRVTEDWKELDANKAATWYKRLKKRNWATPGGSYDAAWSAATSFDSSAAPQWVEWDVTPLVQAWVDGVSANQGVLIIPDAGGAFANFRSKDLGVPSVAPQLVVEYETAVAPF